MSGPFFSYLIQKDEGEPAASALWPGSSRRHQLFSLSLECTRPESGVIYRGPSSEIILMGYINRQ